MEHRRVTTRANSARPPAPRPVTMRAPAVAPFGSHGPAEAEAPRRLRRCGSHTSRPRGRASSARTRRRSPLLHPVRVLQAGAYREAGKQRYHDGPQEVTDMEPLSFGARLWLAILLPFRVLFDAMLAARVAAVVRGQALATLPSAVETRPETKPELAPKAEPKAEPKPVPKVVEPEPEPDRTALQLLAILQREGRFVDFLQEDVSSFSDADIGAAARVVHEGCKRGLKDVLALAAVRTEAEGAKVELPVGFDANRTRVTGNVTGEPPFRGTLAHHGWRVESIRLPELSAGHDPTIIAPAEVEL